MAQANSGRPTGTRNPDAKGGCSTDADCAGLADGGSYGFGCAFSMADACAAVGTCRLKWAAFCGPPAPACACDGTEIDLCTDFDGDYHSRPIAHRGPCSASITDAGPDSTANTDGGPTRCVGCTASQVCEARRTVGGAFVTPDDAGVCPPGRHVEPVGSESICENDWVYECHDRPTGCSGVVDCSCAGNYCGSGSSCSIRTATQSDIECQLLAP